MHYDLMTGFLVPLLGLIFIALEAGVAFGIVYGAVRLAIRHELRGRPLWPPPQA